MREWQRTIRGWQDDRGHYWEEAGPWEESNLPRAWEETDLPDWWPNLDPWISFIVRSVITLAVAWLIAILLADAWCA